MKNKITALVLIFFLTFGLITFLLPKKAEAAILSAREMSEYGYSFAPRSNGNMPNPFYNHAAKKQG